MERQVLMEYPNYSSYGSDGLESYLNRAEQMGAAPIFIKIMRLRELTPDEKNEFINIYCDARFMIQMKGSYDPRYDHPTAGREIEHVPYVNEHDAQFYDPYAPNAKKIQRNEIKVLNSLGTGGKSRRRSNRKSRRR